MKKYKRGIFITSLNSKRLGDALKNRNNFHFNNEVEELDVFVFDTMEVLNGLFFNHYNVEKQQQQIELIIDKLESGFLPVGTIKRELIRCSSRRKELNPYIRFAYDEFYGNPKFESHCRNQIFRNLQPKLKKMSVLNNKSPLIELLVPFLMVEIALYLYIYNQSPYERIYGMETEMEIISAIRSHKYPVFNPFLNKPVDYIKISTSHVIH